MAHDPQQISLVPGEWGVDAEFWLAKALASATLLELQRQWQNGAKLYRVMYEGECVGAYLLRVDSTARGPQGVIVAAAAELAGVDMIQTCMPAIEARFCGVKSIRFHTAKPAVARKMARMGYGPQELICVKEIAA
ncbi:MAG: hypothetical protein RSG22_18050 [Comamonas sp.]